MGYGWVISSPGPFFYSLLRKIQGYITENMFRVLGNRHRGKSLQFLPREQQIKCQHPEGAETQGRAALGRQAWAI